MNKWKHREEGKRVCKSVIAGKKTDQLQTAKKFLSGLLDLRKSEKLYKTYIKGTLKAIEYNGHNKAYSDFRLDGTTTGRLSCAAYNAKKSMGVSFHTLPRDEKTNVRSLFVAPKGYAFLTVDYAAMELRVLSHIAKEGNMQFAFQNGKDLHTYTAQLLFAKEDISKHERQIAKSVSFLIVYGGGAFNLAETMGISLKRADKIIKSYESVYPGIFKFMDFINNFIKENGYAYTIFGRRRHLPDVHSRNFGVVNRALRQGLNFTIQSSASDILLCSLIGIRTTFKDEGLSARVVATVHDSIEIVCPHEEVEQVCKIVHNEMVNYPYIKDKFNIHFDVPLAVDIEVGDSFGDGLSVDFKEGVPLNVNKIVEDLKCQH